MSEFVETPDYVDLSQLQAGMKAQFQEEVVQARSDLKKAVLNDDFDKVVILALSMRLTAFDFFDAWKLAEENGTAEMAAHLQVLYKKCELI